MKKNLLLITLMIFAFAGFSQVFIDEDFSGSFPPEGWSREGVPNQWTQSNSNEAGGIAPEAKLSWTSYNGSTHLITPSLDLTGINGLVMSFNYKHDHYSNSVNLGVAYRVDGGDWQTVWNVVLSSSVGPENKMIALEGLSLANVELCVFMEGNLYDMNYFYLDDVKVYVPLDLDATLTKIDLAPYVSINDVFPLKGSLINSGIQTITSFDVSYTVNGGAPKIYAVSGVDIAIGETYDFTHSDEITLTELGEFSIVTTIENVNGGTDLNPDDNTIESLVSVVPFVPTKKVLAEEATGTWCGFCVRGICFMEYMQETYPENWIGVAIHNGDPMVYQPYDAAMGNIIPGFMGYPQVTNDRTPGDDDPSNLETGYFRRMSVISPATIDIVNYEWDEEARIVNFDLQSEFVAGVMDELRFGVIVTEDSLWGTEANWGQANYYSGGGFGPMCGFEDMPSTIPPEDMHYNHVARIILDTPFGTAESLPTPISAGEVHHYSYSLEIPEEWRYEKLTFIGFLVNSVTGEILNANNVISHYVNLNELQNEIGLSIYPNPAQNELNVSFELFTEGNVEVQVFDMMGKTILGKLVGQSATGKQIVRLNTESLRNGTYVVRVQAGSNTIVKKLIINK